MVWLVALAGGLGAVSRAGVDWLTTRRFQAWVATLMVNIVGSFLLGVAASTLTGPALAIVGAGFCGGFTTFSSACWQAAREFGRRNWRFAVLYTAVTIVGCLTAVAAGSAVGSR